MRRVVFLSLLVACAARPRAATKVRPEPPIDNTYAESVTSPTRDVVLVIDLSKSMMETDLSPDRLGATKAVLRAFVADRGAQRTGVVIFAQAARRLASITDDVATLDDAIARLRIGDLPELGTAIGDGLALAVEELSSCGIVVLIADGDNNVVERYDPAQAAALARDADVVVHTLLVGSLEASTNPAPMQEIALTTGGGFYAVTDAESFDRALRDVGDEIRRAPRCDR